MIVTGPKTARYDVYTLIKTGIDRRCLLPPLPMSSRNPQYLSKRITGAELTAQQLELSYGIVWGCGLKEPMTSNTSRNHVQVMLLSRECFL